MRIGLRHARCTTDINPILSILLVISASVTAADWQGECVGIADGDTITVLRDKKQIKIRLYGVDCPERSQDFGTRAREFVAGIVFRKLVTITPIDTDRYGRTVGLVEVDDREVNRELVAEGYAWIYFYLQNGEPAVVHIDVTDKRPTREEATRLTSIPIEKKSVSGVEIRDALIWLVLGCAIGVGAWFFDRWVIGNFKGPGVLFFGYGAAYLVGPFMPIFGICYCLHKLLRSAQKTKPEAALRWVYEVSYLGDGMRFGPMDYSLATISRIVPDAMKFDRETTRQYLTDFRDTLIRGMEITTAEARKDPPGDWREGNPLKEMTVDGTKELYPGILEMRATITYKDVISRSDNKNNTVNVIAAILKIHITSIMVQSGQYWYPCDIYPSVSIRQESPKQPPAEDKTGTLAEAATGAKESDTNPKRQFLNNLKRIRVGMTEDEADELVGGGVFQMGANVIHHSPYGEFQLLVTDGKVTGTLNTDKIIQRLETELEFDAELAAEGIIVPPEMTGTSTDRE